MPANLQTSSDLLSQTASDTLQLNADGSIVESPSVELFKRLEDKIDESLKKQQEVDAKGTQADRDQHELLVFLTEEQKEILDKMKQMQKDSEGKVNFWNSR